MKFFDALTEKRGGILEPLYETTAVLSYEVGRMSKVVRKAWLTDWSINGMPVVCFREKGEDFETVSTNCFKDKHEALLEISIFENRSFFEEMARS